MKLFVLALFVAVAAAAPLDDSNGPVELIVNGVPEGQALEIGDIVDIKLKEESAGEVIATDLLHPHTAAGIAEAAVAAAAAIVETPAAVVMPEAPEPDFELPASVLLPAPAEPEVEFPDSFILPDPALPEIQVPGSVVLPSPAKPDVEFPGSVALPAPADPEVADAEPLPVAAAQLPIGEVYNDGNVQVNVNVPQEAGVLDTIQGWFNMVLNYISDGTVQTSQQIV